MKILLIIKDEDEVNYKEINNNNEIIMIKILEMKNKIIFLLIKKSSIHNRKYKKKIWNLK